MSKALISRRRDEQIDHTGAIERDSAEIVEVSSAGVTVPDLLAFVEALRFCNPPPAAMITMRGEAGEAKLLHCAWRRLLPEDTR